MWGLKCVPACSLRKRPVGALRFRPGEMRTWEATARRDEFGAIAQQFQDARSRRAGAMASPERGCLTLKIGRRPLGGEGRGSWWGQRRRLCKRYGCSEWSTERRSQPTRRRLSAITVERFGYLLSRESTTARGGRELGCSIRRRAARGSRTTSPRAAATRQGTFRRVGWCHERRRDPRTPRLWALKRGSSRVARRSTSTLRKTPRGGARPIGRPRPRRDRMHRRVRQLPTTDTRGYGGRAVASSGGPGRVDPVFRQSSRGGLPQETRPHRAVRAATCRHDRYGPRRDGGDAPSRRSSSRLRRR